MTVKRTIAMFTAALAAAAVLPAFSSSSALHADDWDDRCEDYWEDREDYYEDLREAREEYYEDFYEDRDHFYVNRYHAGWDDDVRYHTAGYRGTAAYGNACAPVRGCCHVNVRRPARVHHHHHGCCTPAPASCCSVRGY